MPLIEAAIQQSSIEPSRVVIASRFPKISGDPERFQQVCELLLDNVSLHGGPQCTGTLSSKWEGAFVRFQLQDNGPGMQNQLLNRVMEPFVTGAGPSRSNHVGGGLPLAQALVESQGGRLEITASPASGTTVTWLWMSGDADDG